MDLPPGLARALGLVLFPVALVRSILSGGFHRGARA